MQNAAAISTVSWISRSVAPAARAASTSSVVTCRPPALHCGRDPQQGAQLRADRRGVLVGRHLVDQGHPGGQLGGGEGRVGGAAEPALVETGDVGGDQLPLPGVRVGCGARTAPRPARSAAPRSPAGSARPGDPGKAFSSRPRSMCATGTPCRRRPPGGPPSQPGCQFRPTGSSSGCATGAACRPARPGRETPTGAARRVGRGREDSADQEDQREPADHDDDQRDGQHPGRHRCTRRAGCGRPRRGSSPAGGRSSSALGAALGAVGRFGSLHGAPAYRAGRAGRSSAQRRPADHRSHAGDQPLHPLVVRPERVLAQHGALRLVVELQVHPVDGEVAPLLLGVPDELAAQPGPGGLRRRLLGLEDLRGRWRPGRPGRAAPAARRGPGRGAGRGRPGPSAPPAGATAAGRACAGSARSAAACVTQSISRATGSRSPVSTAFSTRPHSSTTRLAVWSPPRRSTNSVALASTPAGSPAR